MRIAQSLYEGISLGKDGNIGLITYIRTDSLRISDVAKNEAIGFISEVYGEKYLVSSSKKKTRGNNTQDAHEAIRPTAVSRTPESIKEYLSKDEYKLYVLIWKRFLASQMADGVFLHTKVDIMTKDYQFTSSGMVQKFDGYLVIYQDIQNPEKDNALPPLEINENLRLINYIPKQHFTQPPARYTEASLIKVLEEKGIGRPSTYVATIETLTFRNYICREDKQFYPTEIGILVNSLLVEYFENIINSEFTADMESKLDEIEEGKIQWKEVISDFYNIFENLLDKAENEIAKVTIEDEVSDEICEKCGRPFLIKVGRYGKFLACSSFPECKNAKPFLEKIGVNCPECSKGEIIVRRSKKGRIFYGCNLYPECNFISWQKPIGKKCPKCHNGHLVEKNTKKKEKIIVCDVPGCGYKEESTNE